MLHALPFTTFGEAAALGLEAHVYCPTCYTTHQVDPMAAEAAVPCCDTRCGVAAPHLPGQIHGKALSTVARGMGREWTGATQSMWSDGPQFHAIARQHAIDGDALFDTPEVRLGWWHES